MRVITLSIRPRQRGITGGRRRFFLVALLLGLACAGCATRPQADITAPDVSGVSSERSKANLRLFIAAWDLVNRKHYDPKFRGVDWERAAATYGPRAAAARDEGELYAVVNEMLNELNDSHTHAFTPEQVREQKTHVRARTGFYMMRVEEKWVVAEVVPGSPAAEAGVKAGWIVVALNGVPLGARLDILPREGEEMKWEFVNEQDQTVTLAPIVRRISMAPRQVAHTLGDGFVYLRFDEFDGKNRRWLGRQLKAHRDAPGIVLDLRRNTGGDTFSLGTAIGEFFDRSVDCGTFVTRSGGRDVKTSWQLGSANYRGPVVLLIDGATGSAAEILAAVLQHHGRGTLVGRRTAGAVLASWFYRLPGGGALQLSREDYIAPNDRRIEGQGVEPDISVPRRLEDVRRGLDRDLETALRLLREGRATRERVGLAPSGWNFATETLAA